MSRQCFPFDWKSAVQQQQQLHPQLTATSAFMRWKLKSSCPLVCLACLSVCLSAISSVSVRAAWFSCPQYGQSHIRQEAAWAASLCHRLRQTPGGSFPLTKKAALLGSLPQTREALQLVRRLRAPGEPDNSTEERLYATRGGVGGQKPSFLFGLPPLRSAANHPALFRPSWWSDPGIGGEYRNRMESWLSGLLGYLTLSGGGNTILYSLCLLSKISARLCEATGWHLL